MKAVSFHSPNLFSARVTTLVQGIGVPVVAVVLAGAAGAFILAASGADPVSAYLALARGAFGSADAVARTLEKATPLALNGLAVALAFNAGLFRGSK